MVGHGVFFWACLLERSGCFVFWICHYLYLYEIRDVGESSKTEIDGSGDLEKIRFYRTQLGFEPVCVNQFKPTQKRGFGRAWRLKKLMKVRPAHFDEMFAVFGCAIILAVAGCSCLNGNKGLEPGLTTAAAKPSGPLSANEVVGLPGVVEANKVAGTMKTDSAVSQTSFQPEIDNPQLQQKFNNLQNRFQQRVDKTKASVNESAKELKSQTRNTLESTRAQLQNQASQVQQKVTSQARKSEQAAQKKATELGTSAEKSVTSGVSEASQKVGSTLQNAADKTGQATKKATTSAGRFLDSLLP
ncbi:MAG: hypothetical protein DWI24_02645 [Planctomycetota bacterium]|nr:MAG: hypothetical protein DWI24_02645 [Planctomycetota bacterium]